MYLFYSTTKYIIYIFLFAIFSVSPKQGCPNYVFYS